MNRVKTLALAAALLLALNACDFGVPGPEPTPIPAGQIYLYGEVHSVEKILDKELELWQGYYAQGLRHLFVEYPYHTAQFLNLWMAAEDDTILEEIYADWRGTQAQSPLVKEFYQEMKRTCPETVFHGTDVGHQYATTGARYLRYLEEKGQGDTDQYRLAQENREQGKYYYQNEDDRYREDKMAENFAREFDALEGESVMGIYGAAHTGLEEMNFTGEVPSMANQLREIYGENLHSEDLSQLAKDIEPLSFETMVIGGKEYRADYFGDQDLTDFTEDYLFRSYWRLEGAYEDFRDCERTGNVLPYNNYPMAVEPGQVFVIDYVKTDGTTERIFYRADQGYEWEGLPSTGEIAVE